VLFSSKVSSLQKSNLALTFESITHLQLYVRLQDVQPNADRVLQNLEIISENFQFSTKRTRILMVCIIFTILLLGTNHKCHGQSLVRKKGFRNNLKNLEIVPPYLQSAVISYSRSVPPYLQSAVIFFSKVSNQYPNLCPPTSCIFPPPKSAPYYIGHSANVTNQGMMKFFSSKASPFHN